MTTGYYIKDSNKKKVAVWGGILKLEGRGYVIPDSRETGGVKNKKR